MLAWFGRCLAFVFIVVGGIAAGCAFSLTAEVDEQLNDKKRGHAPSAPSKGTGGWTVM